MHSNTNQEEGEVFSEAAFSGYSVEDIEISRRFYEEVLDLTVNDMGMGIELQFENGHTVFLYPKDDHEPATFTVLNFPVDDIDGAIDVLSSRGVEFEYYDDLPLDQDEAGVLRAKAIGHGPDIAWFKDPSGNILAVTES